MKETPIIMSGDHPKLILDGIKTQTRRVIIDPRKRQKPIRIISSLSVQGGVFSMGDRQRELELTKDTPPNFPCPYGQVGDRLWVRETWRTNAKGGISFKADEGNNWIGRWKPSIHMFKEFSRITLEITEVRVERVQEITEDDAKAEGCSMILGNMDRPTTRWYFKNLWDSLYAKRGYGWEVNPWVWVIGFKQQN